MSSEQKYFKEKFQGFEPKPDLGVWKEIDGRLDARKAGLRRIAVFRIAAGILALIVSIFVFLNAFQNTNDELAYGPKLKEEKTEIQKIESSKSPIVEEKNEESIKAVNSQKNYAKNNSKSELNTIEESVKTKEKVESKKDITNAKEGFQNENIIRNESIAKQESGNNETFNIEKLQNKELIAELIENESKLAQEPEIIEESILQNKTSGQANKNDIANPQIKSNSVTIVLKPIEDETKKFSIKSFKRVLNRDFYKAKIPLGNLGDVAYNRINLGSN